jgi:hypothetical protein
MKLVRSKQEWLVNPDGTLGWEIHLWEKSKSLNLDKLPERSKVLVIDTEEKKFCELPDTDQTLLFDTLKKYPRVEFYFLTDVPQQYTNRLKPHNMRLGVLMHSQKDVPRLNLLTRQEVDSFVVIDPMVEPVRLIYGTIRWIVIGGDGVVPKKPWVDWFVDDAARFNVPLFVRDSINFDNKPYPRAVPGVGKLARYRSLGQ